MPIEVNEAILASKITGPGQRATLSATLQDEMKAVTIRVNDVEGVAGFVLPGDRVEVVVSRTSTYGTAQSDVVLQNGGTVVDWLMQNGQYSTGNVITTGAAGSVPRRTSRSAAISS